MKHFPSDAEIFSKPMILFLGGKSTGKSSLVNYLLGIDDTPWQVKVGKLEWAIRTSGKPKITLNLIFVACSNQVLHP